MSGLLARRRRPRAAEATGRPRDLLTILVPALLIYIPLLLTEPGQVGADTKSYLYLDPTRLLRDAPFIWHEQIGMGTVTHQNIGYLFPTGPYYWLTEALGVPDWAAQRVWLASVLFAGGMGVRYLLRTVGWGGEWTRRGALLVAVLAYMLSPYFLAYAARISVILLPWAALPWLIALTARSVRSGGWRYPAWFAFAVLVVGGINATALVLVGLGPLLWLVYAVVVEREATLREAASAAARIGALTVATSLWWIAGLSIQGSYGLPVIRYTETFRTVTESSTAPEVFRGLGYWFFYGNDKLGPWIEPSVDYTTNLWLIALSFALPVAALGAAALVRWRHRGFFCLLILVGGLTAVGGYPWGGASPLGSLFTEFTRTDAGLSLRSTPRAIPLLSLGVAVLLGSGVAAVGRRLPRLAVPVAALVALLVVANLPALWTQGLVAENLKRDEEIPQYWVDAAEHLDEGDHATRVLEIPGADFASYRWGNTVDPITPGLIDRPYVGRELFQYGSAQSADLLNAFDRRLQEDVMPPDAIAPIARLLSVGELSVRSDLQFERYRTARPRLLWQQLGRAPGLGAPVGFGEPVENIPDPELPMIDEVTLGTPPDLEDPPPVAAIPIENAPPIIRTQSAQHPLLVAGDGEGIVDAASAGVIDANQLLLSSAWFADDPEGWEQAYRDDADLLVTDTNRRRAQRWGALRENTGYTERAGEEHDTYDPTDQRLEVFPDEGDDQRTVTVLRPREPGDVIARAHATAYGNPITYTPDDRPMLAVDGDPHTAWRVGALDDPTGERLVIEFDEAVSADHVELAQPINLERNRWITEARLHFDEGDAVDVALEDESRFETAPGQRVEIGERTFSRLEIEVLQTNIGQRPRYDGLSGVGFAEVRIPGVGTEELVRPPVDLLDRVGEQADEHRLAYLFTRLRSNPAEPVRLDEEARLRRLLDLPDARELAVRGTARLSAHTDDDTVDHLLGLPSAEEGGVTATSSERLPGSLRQRASAAIDGNHDTFWSSLYQQQQGSWLRFDLADTITFDRMDLTVVADGRHSVPTRVRLEAAVGDADMVPVAGVDLPHIHDQGEPNATVTVPLELPDEIVADELMLIVEEVRQVAVRDWYSDAPTVTPVAIAEMGIPGLHLPAAEGELDLGCRDDLVEIDGEPLPMRASAPLDDALDRRPMELETCENTVAELDAGEHILRSTPGRASGVDVDQLLLASDAEGGPLAWDSLPREVPDGPALVVHDDGRVDADGMIDATDEPFWLVLGQSWSDGWEADIDGAALGAPLLVNGYANGWLVDTPTGEEVAFTLEWTPQRLVWGALGLSVLGLALCLWLMARGRRAPRRRPAAASPSFPDEPTLDWPPLPRSRPFPVGAAAAAGAVTGVAAALNLPVGWPTAVAVPVALVAAVSFWRVRGRSLPVLLATIGLAGATAFVLVQQYRHDYAPDFVWPTEFDLAHLPALAAMLLVGVQGLRDLVERRREASPASSDDPRPGSAVDEARHGKLGSQPDPPKDAPS